MNWYLEKIESGDGKSPAVLYPTPGTRLFANLGDGGPIRAELTINNRVFAISGNRFFEVLSNGTSVIYSNDLINDGTVASITCGSMQVLMSSGGTAHVFDLTANTFTTIPAATLTNVSMVSFSDGYFLALRSNSNTWQISALEDATAWDPADVTTVSVFPDNVVSMIVDHREIWFLGLTRSVVYFDSGNQDFPFDVIPGAYIEQGCAAKFSAAKLDNSLFWLGADERGNGVVWRAQGYTPVRVSNHAVEFAMQGYSTISNAIAYSYQDQGHAFYVLYFPSPGKTWVYDAATGLWHERGSWVSATGQFTAHRSQCHVFAFGKHLVGDWSVGRIYEMSIGFYDDNGQAIRRVRRAPHISNEMEWILHHSMQVDLETGIGLADGQGSDPQITLRWSDDGGHTFSSEYSVSAGKMGEYKKRVIWRRLGRSRDRIYEISVSDPVPWRIIDSYLKVS
jgi:hypothetical protein